MSFFKESGRIILVCVCVCVRDHNSTIHLIAFMVVAYAKGITAINVSSISKLNSLVFTKRII